MQGRLLSDSELTETICSARRIAVLGIMPQSQRQEAAFWVPQYLSSVGYFIEPVPIRFPEAQQILSRPVYRSLLEIPGHIDILNVFVRPPIFQRYVEEVIASQPAVVWFQSGLLALEALPRLWQAGLRVAHECIACRRALIEPSTRPLPSQSEPELGG